MLCRHAHRPLLALAALTLLVGLLGGCVSKGAQPAPSTASFESATAAPLVQMTPEEKSSEIASGFPMQIPVPAGDLERGGAQSPGTWDYVVVVPGDVPSVQRWYHEVYFGAEWVLLSRNASEMKLRKNRAQSILVFEAVPGSPPKTRVTASVGLGVSIDTQ